MPSEPEVTRYTWRDGDIEVHAEARRQRDGSTLWAVCRDGFVWTRQRIGFVWEPRPSGRTDEWLADARWSLAEALEEGPKAVAWLATRQTRPHALR